MWEEIRNLKKTKIGGYNKKSVIDFIKSIATEFTEYKVYCETSIQQINRRISAMTGEKLEIQPDTQREFSVHEMLRSRAVIKENFEQINLKLDNIIQLYASQDNDKAKDSIDDIDLVSQMIYNIELEQNIASEVDSIDAFFAELENEETDEETQA